MSHALDVLYKDHETFQQLLDLIEQEIEAFRRAEQPDYALLEAVLDYFKCYPDCVHHPAEDIIYQKLVARAPERCSIIPDLSREHNRESERLHTFMKLVDLVLAEREIERNTVIEAAEAFLRHMRRHLEMEEMKFFPAAREYLQPEDWRDIDDQLKQNHNRIAGGTTNQFDDLREEIMRWRAELEEDERQEC